MSPAVDPPSEEVSSLTLGACGALRWLGGRIPLGRHPVVAMAAVRSVNRLMGLMGLMLLSLGLMMAVDAPRTLGRLLLLLVAMEAAVWAGAAVVGLMAWLKRLVPPTARRSATPAPRLGGTIAVPIWELDWRWFEAMLLVLLLAWTLRSA